jgi:hypothetical protein
MSPLLRGLAAAAILGAAPASTAYPAPDPVTIPVDANLKFASGTVESIDEARHLLVVKCPAGLVTFHVDRLAVIGPDRKPRAPGDVRPGQKVDVWYHVDDGAIALELDL